MHNLLLALLLVLAARPAEAAELHISGFGGINNYSDPMFIADGDAQDARNVVTYDGDLRTIPGSILHTTVGGSSVTMLGEYINSDGRRVMFAKSGLSVYASNPNTGEMAVIKTFDSEREVDMVSAFGAAYIVDGSASFWSNGVSTYAATNMSACRYVDFYANRLVCVSISTETSRMNLSAYNSSTTWTTGAGDDDAAVKYFSKDDGYQTNCVKATPYGVFVGKDRSSHILKGDSNPFYQFPLSDTVGCSDDRSVQFVDGVIMWMGNEGNVYGWGGEGKVQDMSEEIRGFTKDIRKSQSLESTWSVASQTGWEAGTYTGWETAAEPGVMKAHAYSKLTPELGPMGFAGEGGEAGQGWTSNQTLTAKNAITNGYKVWYGTNVISGGAVTGYNVLQMEDATTGVLIASTSVPSLTADGVLLILDARPDQTVKLRLWYSGNPALYALSPAYNGTRGGSILTGVKSGAGFFDHVEYMGAGAVKSATGYDTKITSPEYQAIVTSGTGISDVTLYTSADNVTFSSVTFPLAESEKRRYWKYGVTYGATAPGYYHSTISAISTATYLSPVTYTSADIAAFKQFTAGYTSVGATPLFYVRSGTYAFTVDGSSPEWVSQSNGGQVAASTAPYVQYKIDPGITTSTQSVTMLSTSLGYLVGAVSPRAASLTYDGHYLLSVSTSSTEANHLTLIYQKNKKWTVAEGQSYGAMAVYNNKPTAGDGTTGSKAWYLLQDGVKSYDGVAIDSWWTTKDYTLGSVNNHKVLNGMWINAAGGGVTDLNISWLPDRAGVWYSTATALSGSDFVIREVDGLFSDYNLGRQARFKFSASEADADFKLKMFSIYFTINPLIK